VSYNHSPLFPPSAIIGLLTFKHLFFDVKCPNHFLVSILFPTDLFFFFFSCQLLHGKIDSRHFYTCCCYMCVHTGMLYVGRIVGGLAGGICCVVAPSYIGTCINFKIIRSW
jgi:MFS family permease